MSVTLRSCASMTLLSFSGCDERDGGERRSVRCSDEAFVTVADVALKSEVVSKVTEGAIVA